MRLCGIGVFAVAQHEEDTTYSETFALCVDCTMSWLLTDDTPLTGGSVRLAAWQCDHFMSQLLAKWINKFTLLSCVVGALTKTE